MLSEQQQKELGNWRETADKEDRQLAALEMIADQLSAIHYELFQARAGMEMDRQSGLRG